MIDFKSSFQHLYIEMHHVIMQEASDFLVQTFRLQISFYELLELLPAV